MGQGNKINGRMDLGLPPVNFQTQRMGFVLKHIQHQQKNLEHFSEESDVVYIVEVGEGLRAKRRTQKPSVRRALKEPIRRENE